jgi:peptide/nickel transport system substrate-binding protein
VGDNPDLRNPDVLELMNGFLRGRISRRELMVRAGILGISLTAIPALLAACANATSTSTTNRGGTLRVAAGGNGQNDTLNTAKIVDPIDGIRILGLYDQLFQIDSHGNPQPWLCQSFDVSADAKTWTLRLVQGATWHNGAPVTADDVKFTINYLMDPATKANIAGNLGFLKGADLTVMDKRTLRVTLQNPYADLPAVFAHPGGTYILPQTYDASKANTAPIGSGPFKFVSFTPGTESTMVRNTNYWNSKYPLVDKLVITDITDTSARNNALIGNQVDLVININYSDAAPLKAGGAQVINLPGTVILPVVCVEDMTPMKNANVRMALALSIDRQKAVDIVYKGYGRIGNDQPISDSYPYHPVGIPQRTLDITKAKQLLSDAGYPNGIDLTLITADASPGMLDMSTVVAEQAAAAGFRITLKKWATDTFWDEVWLKQNFYMSAWTQAATPDLFLARSAITGAVWNETHISDPQLDTLLVQARQITDAAKRTQLYTQAMTIVWNHASWIIPGYGNTLHAGSSKFKWETPPPGRSAPSLHNASVS